MKQITLLSETDIHGKILFVNEAFCEVSQYSKEELVGKPHSIIRHPEMPKELFEFLWRTITETRTFRGIIKNQAKDGSHYWVQCTIMPILDNQHQVLKYIGVRHLITDEAAARERFHAQTGSMYFR